MAGKSKFQISRSLDERITKLTTCIDECDPEFAQVNHAFILGWHSTNVTNYVGLSQDHQLSHANLQAVGLAYFRQPPSDDDLKSKITAIQAFSKSHDGLGSSFQADKNEHLYLIYSQDELTKAISKRVFDAKSSSFLEPQPKLSLLDEAKIYAHSAMFKLNVCLRLDILETDSKLQSKEKLEAELDNVKKMLSPHSGGFSLHLLKSNFSSKTPLSLQEPLESLYSHLDIPKDVEQMGDYLPQMSKEEKKKNQDKWRNKVKDQRAPLELQLHHDDLSVGTDDNVPVTCYKLNLDKEFIYLQVNDSIAKSTELILFALRHKLELIKRALLLKADHQAVEVDEIKSCLFKPTGLNHLVPVVYMIPAQSKPNYEQLKHTRHQVHKAYLMPLDRPAVRYSQRVINVEFKNADEQSGYLCNVHLDILEKSGLKGGSKSVSTGTYTYHHYLQDRAQDSGWGCAYRSLQTIISWFKHQAYIYSPDIETRAPKSAGAGDRSSPLRARLNKESRVPTHEEIQAVLVDVGDKQPSFIGSQKWIGSQEVCYVLNHLYDLDSKFISVSSGSELVYKARDLGQHFATQWTPIMIGGGVLAHTIIGVDFNEKNGDISYLILDPHYTGSEDLATITKKGWCGWKKNAFWDKSAFYNLCLPQRPVEI